MKKISSIPRCSADKINWDQFRLDHFLGSRPLIIENALEEWSALQKWSSCYFNELYAGRTLTVGNNNRAVYSRLATNKSQTVQRDAIELECSEAMKRIESGGETGTYYLQKQSIPDVFPELMKDITPPPFVAKEELTDINLWFGGAGNITPLHFDFSNNFLAQVTGVKEFVLISPTYYSECYPADGTNLNHLSRADLEAPDYDQFPKFKEVEFYQSEIHPGDLLYIPPFWWHFVRLLETSISINFWWKSHIDQCVFEAATRRLPNAFQQGNLSNALKQLDKRGYNSISEIAESFLEKGLTKESIFIAASVIDEQLSGANNPTKPNQETDLIDQWRQRWQPYTQDISAPPEIQKARENTFKRLEDLLADEQTEEPTKEESKLILEDIFATSKYAAKTA